MSTVLKKCDFASRSKTLCQWRTQKIFMGGVWFRVIWWSFGVRCL